MELIGPADLVQPHESGRFDLADDVEAVEVLAGLNSQA